jgi:hypothetical protein
MEASRATSTAASSANNQERSSTDLPNTETPIDKLSGNGEAASTGNRDTATTRTSREYRGEKNDGKTSSSMVALPNSEQDKEAKEVGDADDNTDCSSSIKTGLLTKVQERCLEQITHQESSIPLAWQALLTGLVDALIYGKSTIWTGFQTGERRDRASLDRSVLY